MMNPRQTAAGLAADVPGPSAHYSTARQERRPQRTLPLTRRYEVAGLTPFGEIMTFTREAPATPVFEEAFAGFARGTLIATPGGGVAVEDLVPGMEIDTADCGRQRLLWVGSMTMRPGLPDQGEDAARLTRATADSFAVGKPMPDLVLGPRSRLLYRNQGCMSVVGTPAAFAPARAFVDGVNVFTVLPVSPVQVYHLALDGQHVLRANGMEIESYHPGHHAEMLVERETKDLFLSLFPHADGFDKFGPMPIPRLTAFELDGLRSR